MSKEIKNNEITENEETEIAVKETKSGSSLKKFLIGSIVGALVGVAGTIFVKKKFTNDDYDDFDDDLDDDDFVEDVLDEDDDFEDSENDK